MVTGAEGFIGLHTRFFFHEPTKQKEFEIVPVTREVFEDDSKLREALTGAEIVIHLAGINRASDEELEAGNKMLAEKLVAALEKAGATPHILFSSSLHQDRDTSYGRGKKAAGEVLMAFGKKHGTPVSILVLPHVFGEFARPRYNSAVATFCADLAEGKPSTVDPNGAVELLYVGDVVKAFYAAIQEKKNGEIRLSGVRQTIPKVYGFLEDAAKLYRQGSFGKTNSAHELALFNTLQSAFFDTLFPFALTPKADARGVLYEMVRSGRVDQVFFSVTKPGEARGNHYHTHKMERFCVVKGTGEIRVRKLLQDNVKTFPVSGENPIVVDMPTYQTHSLVNTGTEDLYAVFWISEQFNPDDPDTIYEDV